MFENKVPKAIHQNIDMEHRIPLHGGYYTLNVMTIQPYSVL